MCLLIEGEQREIRMGKTLRGKEEGEIEGGIRYNRYA